MCLIMLGFKCHEFGPILIGANRDEFYDRPTVPPRLLPGGNVLAGIDKRAGGTWLGVNRHGVVAAVTNSNLRPASAELSTSRGELCLSMLDFQTAVKAGSAAMEKLKHAEYNPFTLLLVDREKCVHVSNTRGPKCAELEPGWHVVGNTKLDATNDLRVLYTKLQLYSQEERLHADPVGLIQSLCSDHGEAAENPEMALCVHKDDRGTRSSTILTVDNTGKIVFRHADGPPCTTPYKEIAIPWQEPHNTDSEQPDSV